MRTVAGVALIVLIFFWGCIHLDVAVDRIKDGKAFWYDFAIGLGWIFIAAPSIVRAGRGLMYWLFNLS